MAVKAAGKTQTFNQGCLEGLREHGKTGSARLFVCDPPYFMGLTSNGKKGSFNDLNMAAPFFRDLFSEIKRVLREDGELFWFTDWKGYAFFFPLLDASGLCPRNTIVWDKLSGPGNHFNFQHEMIVYCSPKSQNKKGGNVWREKSFSSGSKWEEGGNAQLIPAQKPLALMEKIISENSAPGDLVIDCFLGSGTSAIAARNLGRNFLGFEIDPKTYALMENRLKKTTAGKPGPALGVIALPSSKGKKKPKPKPKFRILTDKSPKNAGACFASEIPIADIHTDEARFQNRHTAFSEISARKVAESYDPNKFDPITVWEDPKNGRTHVISGHSRFEGMKRRKAKTIPAKYFEGTEEEAIKYARLDANRGAEKESLIEDLSAYRLSRDGDKKAGIKPAPKKEIEERFKGRQNKLENWSRLNPSGLFLMTLGQNEARNDFPGIERYASWAGELWEEHPKTEAFKGMTNRKEDEIFNYFYNRETGAANRAGIDKARFFAEVSGRMKLNNDTLFDCKTEGCKGAEDIAKHKDPDRAVKQSAIRCGGIIETITKRLKIKPATGLDDGDWKDDGNENAHRTDAAVAVYTKEERDYLLKLQKRKMEDLKRLHKQIGVMEKNDDQTSLFGVPAADKPAIKKAAQGALALARNANPQENDWDALLTLSAGLAPKHPYMQKIAGAARAALAKIVQAKEDRKKAAANGIKPIPPLPIVPLELKLETRQALELMAGAGVSLNGCKCAPKSKALSGAPKLSKTAFKRRMAAGKAKAAAAREALPASKKKALK